MSERWKPIENEHYYHIDLGSLGPIRQREWTDHEYDEAMYDLGNCFNTKTEAEAAYALLRKFMLSLHEPISDRCGLPKLTAAVFNREDCPDWCRVGEFGYDHKNKVYFRIKRINNESIVLQYPYNEDVESNLDIEFFMAQNPTQAHLRPYDADEMKALVGKVIENKYYVHFINRFDKKSQEVVSGNDSYSAKLLKAYGYAINGKPCGVLEHLENGEWVE